MPRRGPIGIELSASEMSELSRCALGYPTRGSQPMAQTILQRSIGGPQRDDRPETPPGLLAELKVEVEALACVLPTTLGSPPLRLSAANVARYARRTSGWHVNFTSPSRPADSLSGHWAGWCWAKPDRLAWWTLPADRRRGPGYVQHVLLRSTPGCTSWRSRVPRGTGLACRHLARPGGRRGQGGGWHLDECAGLAMKPPSRHGIGQYHGVTRAEVPGLVASSSRKHGSKVAG